MKQAFESVGGKPTIEVRSFDQTKAPPQMNRTFVVSKGTPGCWGCL